MDCYFSLRADTALKVTALKNTMLKNHKSLGSYFDSFCAQTIEEVLNLYIFFSKHFSTKLSQINKILRFDFGEHWYSSAWLLFRTFSIASDSTISYLRRTFREKNHQRCYLCPSPKKPKWPKTLKRKTDHRFQKHVVSKQPAWFFTLSFERRPLHWRSADQLKLFLSSELWKFKIANFALDSDTSRHENLILQRHVVLVSIKV